MNPQKQIRVRQLIVRACAPMLAVTVLASGCATQPTTDTAQSSTAQAPSSEAVSQEALPAQAEPQSALPDAQSEVMRLAQAFVQDCTEASMDDVAKIEAIYCSIIERIYFAEPPDPDYWVYRCDPNAPPSYLYNRAMAPLSYGVGSCEDFAAALTVILHAAGFEAQYVSGLTISAQRQWVDHAWTVVRVGEDWYHLDSQLEQNTVKENRLTFRYFLRDDAWMLADHLWGGWLAAYWQGKQTPEQRELLLRTMTPPLCEGMPSRRPKERILLPHKPEKQQVLKMLETQREAYLAAGGNLPTVSGEWESPLFSVMPGRQKEAHNAS